MPNYGMWIVIYRAAGERNEFLLLESRSLIGSYYKLTSCRNTKRFCKQVIMCQLRILEWGNN